jgi:hypothetical protein
MKELEIGGVCSTRGKHEEYIQYFGREITRKETTQGTWEYVRYYRYLKDT